MSTATKTTYTSEDLLEMPDGDNYELVDGQLVERSHGCEASYIAGRILGALREFCNTHHLGWVFPGGAGYQCFPHAPNNVRRTDVSFIAFGRLPDEMLPKGHCKIAPDLAVEVVSPNDRAYKLDEKVEEYLAAGVRLVWVVNPETRTVRVHRPDGTAVTLRNDDELSGESVLPDFRCRVSEFFRLPTAAK